MAQQCSAPWFLPSVGLLLPTSRGGIPESDPRDDVAGTWDKKRYSIRVAGEEWVDFLWSSWVRTVLLLYQDSPAMLTWDEAAAPLSPSHAEGSRI